ncbi:MAG: DNA-binding protein [[Eubacterium] rectale]|nr:DNA-binding protein [Agathobacter rectalis]
MFREYPDVVSISQLSQMLCISEKTAYRLLKENKIEYFKIGRTYRIPKISVLAYMSVNA